jgi:hypothetical protein
VRNRTNDKDPYSLNTSITSQYDESSSIKINGVSDVNNEAPTLESSHALSTQNYEFTNGPSTTTKIKSTKKTKTTTKSQSQNSNDFATNSASSENNHASNSHINSSSNTYNYTATPNTYNFQNHGLSNHEQSSSDPASISSGYSIQNILNFAAQQCSASNGNTNPGSLNNFSNAYSKFLF